jgi:DNA-directed RNA polymerase subunit RPC12/RpoP
MVIFICKDCRNQMVYIQQTRNSCGRTMEQYRCTWCGRMVEEIPDLPENQKYK